MERVKLRIRIPKLWLCPEDTCSDFSKNEYYCDKCLYARMGKEVPSTTFPGKIKLVHCPSLRGNGGSLAKIH